MQSVGNPRCGSNVAIFSMGATPTAWEEALPHPQLYPSWSCCRTALQSESTTARIEPCNSLAKRARHAL